MHNKKCLPHKFIIFQSVSITPVKTIPITPQVRAASGGANPVGRSLLALAIEGKAPQTITNQPVSRPT